MRKRTIWTLAGAVVAVLIIAGAVGPEWLLGLSERVLNPVRYRVETRLEVGDHARLARLDRMHSEQFAGIGQLQQKPGHQQDGGDKSRPHHQRGRIDARRLLAIPRPGRGR